MLKTAKNYLLYSLVLLIQPANQPPVIEINQPKPNDNYGWNSILPFSIKISDKEDGESRYDEITSSEVLVTLKILENKSKANLYLHQKSLPDTLGLMNMVHSNCFNCHAGRSKMAGPSFEEIFRKYKQSPDNKGLLVSHILHGSTGIWGKEVMPTHPELDEKTAKQMVNWIFRYANDSTLSIATGLQGSFSLMKPAKVFSQSQVVLSAYYTDHGTPGTGSRKLAGSAHLTLSLTVK